MPEPSTSQPQPSTEPDLTGQQFGDYQVLRQLGQGAMAEVYLALQKSLNRNVALKVLRPSLSGDENYVLRFHNEARAAASLVHANIVQIHEVGRINGTHFIAQEYVRGQNLGQYLKRHGPISVPLSLLIMRQACAALQRASEESIVHRDIKPENIMLSAKGEVKVADFGLARAQNDAVNLTQVGITMGTPLYMSPEQIEGKSLDSRSDIYSLGVSFFHMLTGTTPFTGDSPLNVAIQHLQNEPPDLASIRHDLPETLCRMVHRMIAKSPADRYQTPRDLLHELSSLQSDTTNVEWPAEIELLGSSDFSTMSTSRIDATQRLDVVMKRTSGIQQTKKTGHRWVQVAIGLTCFIAFVVGATIALSLRKPDLLQLTPSEQQELFNRFDSAKSQFRFARLLQTESGYRSVQQYFPEDKYYVNMANVELARLYLKPPYSNPDKALQIFQELSSLDETNGQFRATGIAGEAIVYHWRNKFQKSQARLAELAEQSLLRQLEPGWRRELEQIRRKNLKALGQAERSHQQRSNGGRNFDRRTPKPR